MTELQLRKRVVDSFKDFEGCVRGDARHRELIDTYNKIRPLPRNHIMTYKESWCAAAVSAIGYINGLTDYILPECSCSKMIDLYRQINRWEESDSYTPKIGDLVMYDWDDSGSGDNTGAPEHVGMVIEVNGKDFTVLEGNKSSKSICGTRSMKVNGKYIRGFCLPNYQKAAVTLYPATAPIKTTPITVEVLKKGSQGASVKVLQALLVFYGFLFSEKEIDGIFGSRTDQAVRDFQNNYNLEVDGICGGNTWSCLINGI